MDPTDPMQPQEGEEYIFKVLKELTTREDIEEFNKKAKNGKNNTFIIYFAHWCPHCRALTPELIKLDEFLSKNVDKVNGQVVRISDEHIGELEVFNKPDGFPTIVILDGDGEKQKDFSGPRTMNGFLDFLIRNGVYGGGMRGGKKVKRAKKTKNAKSAKAAKKTNKAKAVKKTKTRKYKKIEQRN